jgi:hypothetical protein
VLSIWRKRVSVHGQVPVFLSIFNPNPHGKMDLHGIMTIGLNIECRLTNNEEVGLVRKFDLLPYFWNRCSVFDILNSTHYWYISFYKNLLLAGKGSEEISPRNWPWYVLWGIWLRRTHVSQRKRYRNDRVFLWVLSSYYVRPFYRGLFTRDDKKVLYVTP